MPDGLDGAAGAAVAGAVRPVVVACPLTPVSPQIAIRAPKLVLVRKPYQVTANKRPHRIAVRLGASRGFGGTGDLTHNAAGGIDIYATPEHGAALPMPHSIPGGTLAGGVTLYVQAVTPSGTMLDTTLTLTLNTGEPKANNPATDQLTRIELHLDLCVHKAVPGGADPAPLPGEQRVDPGRHLHLQTKQAIAGRLLMIVRRTTPADYAGNVVLKRQNNKVSPYAYAQEESPRPPQAPDAPQPGKLTTANQLIDAGTGLRLWVEGRKVSGALKDTGFTVEISDLPRREGDRGNITVVETRIDVCQSRPKKGATPVPISKKKKMDPGRYLHLQDAGNHHGRARVVVKRVKPAAFNGNLDVTVWDETAKNTATARVQLFAAEATGGAAHPNPHPIAIPGGFPASGDAELWTEGALVSPALRDTELRLKVTDAEGWADQAALTVCQFSVLKADIPSTPAVTNRMGNSPVNRHEKKIADPAAGQNDFDEDYVNNPPLVLIERSVRSADQINLSVSVAPAGVPVRWAVIRDRRPAPDGDDKKHVIGLSGNREAPTLGSKGESLTNTLRADAVGSFHICPFVDCNDNKTFDFMAKDGTRIDREPFIMMNLVLVRVTLRQDDSITRSANMVATLTGGGGISLRSGAFNINAPAGEAIHMNVQADLVGGGNVGRRGLDSVFAGWCNNETANEDIGGTFTTLAPPPRNHRNFSVFASNLAAATGANNTFLPGDPAPALVAPALLDTGRGSAGTGGETATLTRSRIRTRNNLAVGQRWLVESIDSPGDGEGAVHPGFPGTVLVRFRFHLDFRTFLCFWTNTSNVSGATGDPCDRLYSVLREYTWKMRGEWTIGGGVLTVVTPASVKISGKTTHKPIARAADTTAETRDPTGLNLLGRDGRA